MATKVTAKLPPIIAAVDIYEALRHEMQRLYYTPKTLAVGLGLPRRTVTSWVNGHGLLSREQYRAICKHLGVKRLSGPMRADMR